MFLTATAEAHFKSFYNKKSKKHTAKYSPYYYGYKHSCFNKKNTVPKTPPKQVVCSEDERVVNGDFESDTVTNSSRWQLLPVLTGWQIEWTKQGCCKKSPLAELQAFENEQLDGSTQYIELDTHYQNGQCTSNTNIQISQQIPAQVGEVLKLEFNYRPRSLVNGKMELTTTFGNNTFVLGNFTSTSWKQYSKSYTVTSKDLKNGKINLLIKDTGLSNTYGMFVDNVSVRATNCISVPKLCSHATSVVSYNPVGNIAANRKNSSKALGQPDGEPVNESNIKFTTLGFGGEIVLKLDSPVKNVVGPDLRIWETTGGNMSYYQYQEESDVYVSKDGINWVYAGHVMNDNDNEEFGLVDIGPLEEALYVKIIDQSPFFNEAGRDGFDVDAVTCYNQENEYEAQFYYLDNSAQKIYKGAVEGNNVFLKEFMISPFSSAHIAQLTAETLVVVESAGDKRIREITIGNKAVKNSGTVKFLGTTGAVYANQDYVLVNQNGTNRIYTQDLDPNSTTLLAQVTYNNLPLILTDGDLFQSLSGSLFVVTASGGGRLFALENHPTNDEVLVATLIEGNLGAVSGLIELPSGEMLVSISNSTVMKVVNIWSKTVRNVNLKGDLLKQGTQGGDLGSFDSL